MQCRYIGRAREKVQKSQDLQPSQLSKLTDVNCFSDRRTLVMWLILDKLVPESLLVLF